MKMIFFLIAFFLISIRVYYSWSGKDRERRGLSDFDLVIKSDNFYEEINYAGKFEITEDESSFKNISPGGYFKFRLNEEKVKAESNLQGNIEYSLFDGKNKLSLNEGGRELIRQAIHEMFAWGYDAKGHMETIYHKGGVKALIMEIDSMKSDEVRMLYLRRLFEIDTLSSDELLIAVDKIKSLGSDPDKIEFLGKVSHKFKNPVIDSVYFDVVGNMRSDIDKVNALNQRLEEDSLATADKNTIIKISGRLGSDVDKGEIYGKMIDLGMIEGDLFDSLIRQISYMSSDIDKLNLYSKMVQIKSISEMQWMTLINKATEFRSDIDKANMFTDIAKKMPMNEVLKSAFLKGARTIGNDNDYGKVIRIIQ